MKSVLALSALLFARAVFAQDSLSTTPTPSATDSVVSVTPTDSANLAAQTTDSISASITGSSSASHTGTKSKTSSTAAAAATAASYKIPSGISSGCSAFLQALDSDSQLGSCTAPLLKATSAFGPGSSSTQSQSALVSALDTLCSSTGCSDKYVRTQLTKFASACKDELDPDSGNKGVRDTYDILYVMQPWQDALCTKDNGSYCVLQAASSDSAATSSSNTNGTVNAVVSGGSDADLVNSAIEDFYAKGASAPGTLRKRASQSVYSPDTAAYRASGVMYLYTLPDLSATSLCTTCTQEVINAYFKWEATIPYAAGLANSPMLGDQAALYKQVQTKCGSTFMNVAKAGTANAETNAGVSSTQVGVSSAIAGAFAVAMGFWVAL
ncbi:hypothetical protein FRB90_007291 [Tulasnella sp. 427]|nr:hypothetical protein FRB90_007291 [Tulasnella sp. 427]